MEWSFPWLSIDGDRMYDDSDFSRFFEGLFSYGVSLTTANALKVTASPNGGMKVQVDSGYSFTGKVFLNSSAKALSIDVASSTQDRTDSIVVRMDKSVRDVFLAVKKNDTTVTRTSDVYELQLATIRVPRNVSSITGDLITDKRADEKVCGYSSPFQKVNVSGLEDQYTALLKAIIDKMNQYTEDEKVKFEADMQAILTKGNEYIQQAQADWQTFLESISQSMEGDIALNLQKQITSLTPDQLLFTKNDLPFDYPMVEVLALINGFGITPLGEENWLGDIPETIPNRIGYPKKNAITVKVPTDWKMSSPKISEVSPFVYLLNEGNKSVQIKIKESN
ncbi:structural protein [Enterococcus faecalis]|uniref:structural protein n=1 Tax=Enterococcus TaxID=1350 RepID=UPI000CF0D174|nr:structural protein [Enterococcus faecalis]EGO2679284.1 structural protein [Enterococcus faecalis]EGO5130448.1 structural protein [Enterococcus faecalis]EGO6130157.1 structural protein [Enterococcus faecalis]EGO8789281.1 structural protein [Enterococcus faecalis]EGO8861790.1 structural protein [Enterococcus faecalis]